MGTFEAAVGAEAPYAYLLSHDTVLAKAFAERAFRLAPLRLQALAHMLGKGEIETQLGQQRTDLQRRTQYLAHVLQSQFGQRVVFDIPQGGQMLWVSFASRWRGTVLPQRWQVLHCTHYRVSSSACRGITLNTLR